jgi:glutamyl-Q tRNA(Asp) synthetase
MPPSVFRFAPSPNGDLHLGHALSALINAERARDAGGRLLVRIEDLDPERTREVFIERILSDLDWLGIAYERPVWRQSGHLNGYRLALDRLTRQGLVYPGFASRREIRQAIDDRETISGEVVPLDPDGAPVYPGFDRDLDPDIAAARIATGAAYALRLDMAKAAALAGPLTWQEKGEGRVAADPLAWGDVVLARKDAPASYHLAVVVDDAAQGVSDVVRGRDLYFATAIHRLLQTLLGLPEPRYEHHRLILGSDGRKLSKSEQAESLRARIAAGATPQAIRRLVGM